MWVVVLLKIVDDTVEAVVTGFPDKIEAMGYAGDCNADPENLFQAFAIFTKCVHCSK